MARGTIVLPTEAYNFDKAADEIKRALSEKFGGYTTYDAQGGWINEEGELIDEPVKVYETYTDNARYSVFRSIAHNVRVTTGEDAVMFTINNESHFI